MGVCDHHLEAIGHLTQLKNITLRVCPHETTAAGLAGLTAHGLLSSLEHLSLYDAELPCASLAEHLSGASKLTALQFGLNSVCTSLAALTRIKSLQVGWLEGVLAWLAGVASDTASAVCVFSACLRSPYPFSPHTQTRLLLCPCTSCCRRR